jgi:hypothetical protein
MIMCRYTYNFVSGIVAKKSALQEIVANNQQLYTNRPGSGAFDPGIALLSKSLFFLGNLTLSPHLYGHTPAQRCTPGQKKTVNHRAYFPQNRVAFPQHRVDWATEFGPL